MSVVFPWRIVSEVYRYNKNIDNIKRSSLKSEDAKVICLNKTLVTMMTGLFTNFSRVHSRFGCVSGCLIYRSHVRLYEGCTAYSSVCVLVGFRYVEFGYLTTKSLTKNTHLIRWCNLNKVQFYMRLIYKLFTDSNESTVNFF